jgi:hypothetical protein
MARVNLRLSSQITGSFIFYMPFYIIKSVPGIINEKQLRGLSGIFPKLLISEVLSPQGFA